MFKTKIMRTQNPSNINSRKLDIINLIKNVEDNSLIEKVWKILSKVPENKEKDNKEAILKNMKAGFEEMKLIKQGKLKATPLKDFLDEL